MKNMLAISIAMIFILTQTSINYAQQNDSSKIIIDYRNRINIPEYDPSLMPLNNNNKTTGVWTELNPKVPRVDYLGIHFINKDTGWACGANGAIIKTTNGGNNWKHITIPTTSTMLKVRSHNGQIVIASGYDGLILRSTNGGETFTQVTSGVTGGIWGLQMINDTLGWACGATALLKTTDGGITWQRILTPGYTGNLWWIDFHNEKYGFIAGDGKVLKTTNGGINWAIIQAGDPYPLFALDVIDSLHIAAAGYGGTGYPAKNIYSSDGGNTWINGGFITTSVVNCVKYISRDIGYLLQSDIGLYKTTNRGQSWFRPTGEIGEYELSILPGNIGYIAGTQLKLYKAEGNLDVWRRLIINEHLSDVYFTSELKGFAISSGVSGKLFKTENAGINWRRVENAHGGNVIVFTDSLTGFIGASDYSDVIPVRIYKTTDGGVNWNATNITETIGGVYKIFFINQTTGWATTGWAPTSNAKILKTTDGGENWFVQLQQTGSDGFTSIFFIDSLNGWAASRYIWQTTNGGANWIQRTDIPALFPDDIYFSNHSTGWVARQSTINPSLYKSTDAGLFWTALPEVLGARKFHLFPDTNHWIITGLIITSYIVRKTYQTYDGGNTWIDISNDVPTGFSGFSAVTNLLGYAVGGGGLILRYNDTNYIPVELVLFQGKVNNNEIVLTWVTASELNNQGFYINKSFDKINWKILGFVNGKGSTTNTNYYSFIDSGILTSEIYYQLVQQDYNGSKSYSDIIEVHYKPEILSYEIYQNFPNPFNFSTVIKFQLPKKEFVNLSLYNIIGEKIFELVNEEKNEGIHIINFAKDIPSGVYFYRLVTSSGYTANKKLISIK